MKDNFVFNGTRSKGNRKKKRERNEKGTIKGCIYIYIDSSNYAFEKFGNTRFPPPKRN